MSIDKLGQLTPVALRDVWTSEASDFTPWLASEENLSILGKTLGIDLELEAQEKAVGPFRADILCKDINTGAWVLVENQLERTDHGHLGQLLTYASGLEAVTIIWISARFTEEHRSTLDWLNRITDDSIRLFGLEVELWRIGDSDVAPKFNIVSKPNDWSRSVAQAKRAIDESDLSEVRIMQRDYWTAFHEVLDRLGGPISGSRKPQPKSWMSYPIGRTGMNLGTVMNRPEKRIYAQLYLATKHAKAFFHLLLEQRVEVERKFDGSLEWEELPERQDCRIAVYRDQTDPENRGDWTQQHEWLAKSLNDLHRAFAGRVKALDADDWNSNEGTGP